MWKVKFKRIYDLFIKNFSIFLFSFIKIIIFPLIIIIFFSKYEYALNLEYEMKLFYKDERNLNIPEIQKEIKELRYSNSLFDKRDDFIKIKNPKISLIITVYNQEHFLRYCYSSIQKQELKDIEIIFIDDASEDNSSEIILSLMEKDKRIIYLKNKTNKRAFYSRNRGALFSNGEYILILDPDDLLLNNILFKSYEIAKYFNLDILQYYVLRGSYSKNKIWLKNKYKSGILYDKEIKDVFFYSVSRTLWDKLIAILKIIKKIK